MASPEKERTPAVSAGLVTPPPKRGQTSPEKKEAEAEAELVTPPARVVATEQSPRAAKKSKGQGRAEEWSSVNDSMVAGVWEGTGLLSVWNDPIQLTATGESLTEQLGRQLRGFEREFEDPGLMVENMQKEFGKIMGLYQDNHESLLEFKSRFEGKQQALTGGFTELGRDLAAIKGEVGALGERSTQATGELERIRGELGQLGERIRAHDEKYEVDMSETQEQVTHLEQEVARLEVEKVQRELAITQQKSRLVIENLEEVGREREKTLKAQYEQKILELVQSKEIDIGEKQLLEMQKETINHAMAEAKAEMGQKLLAERERAKELMAKMAVVEEELHQKNDQIHAKIAENAELHQRHAEAERLAKQRYAEELERRLREKQQQATAAPSSADALMKELATTRELLEQRTNEVEQLRAEQRGGTRQMTPTNKDRQTMKQMEERFHKLEKERDSLEAELRKTRKELNTRHTPQTDHRFHTTPIAHTLLPSPPTSPLPRSEKLFAESPAAGTRSRNLRGGGGGSGVVGWGGGTLAQEEPSERILRKFKEEIEEKKYELSFDPSVGGEDNCYQLGDKRIHALMSHDGSILVRVGGGFVSMGEYLAKYTSKQQSAAAEEAEVEMSLQDFLDIEGSWDVEPAEEENTTPISKYTETEEEASASQTFGRAPEEPNQFDESEIQKCADYDDSFAAKREERSLRKDQADKMDSLSRGWSSQRPKPAASTASTKFKGESPSLHQLENLRNNSGLVVGSHHHSKRRSASTSKAPAPKLKATASSPSLLRHKTRQSFNGRLPKN